MLEEYDLHQVTMDDSEEYSLQLEGSLLVWQAALENDGELVDDVIGYDIDRKELLGIGVGELYLETRPHLSKGQVVLTREGVPKAEDYERGAYMMLWNATTRNLHELDVGLEGEQESFAFDGEWVVFGNRGSSNASENALWAFNVEDRRLTHIYTPVPGARLPDGSHESVSTPEVHEGIVYYEIRRVSTDQSTPNSTLYRFQLSTGARDIIYSGPLGIGSIDVEGRWLAISADVKVWLMDLNNLGTFEKISVDDAGHPDIQGDWLVFDDVRTHPIPILWSERAYHIPTGRLFTLIEGNGLQGGFATQQIVTNGNIVVFALHRSTTEIFESLGTDLYWMDLPSSSQRE